MTEGFVKTIEEKQAELEDRLDTLNNELSSLGSLHESMETALDRLLGSPPQETEEDGVSKAPQSYIERLDDALYRLRSIRMQFGECKSRLEDAI